MSTPKQSSTPTDHLQNGDRINNLIQAARADERAQLQTQALLSEIRDALCDIRDAQRDQAKELEWIKGIVQSTYNNVATLIQLMSAIWRDDRTTLVRIQGKIAEEAFKEGASAEIAVRADGNVTLSADKVGRDKKHGTTTGETKGGTTLGGTEEE